MTEALTKITLEVEHTEELQNLFGVRDANLKILETELEIEVITRGQVFHVFGKEESLAIFTMVFDTLLPLLKKGTPIYERDVSYCINLARNGKIEEFSQLYEEEIVKSHKGKPIKAKTLGQKQYVQAIKNHDLVFGIGPAGTGKTYLAVVMAVAALKSEGIKKIILTRPAVEAGESLGFLPGDLKEKVDPYLRPLYDALHDLLGVEHTERLIDRGIIEIAPLAYMRGRTLQDAFVILDEAQNTTPAQMKMFLTRLGFHSKMVITGDPTQIDLPKGVTSGILVSQQVLQNVSGISFIHFDSADVVRHPLVQKIIDAYSDNLK